MVSECGTNKQSYIRANIGKEIFENQFEYSVYTSIFFLVMDHLYKSLLMNLPCRHIINNIETTDDALKKQIERIKNVDVANFFLLASMKNINRVLNMVTYT